MDRKKITAVVGVLASVALIGGAFAYFSGTAEQKQNKFSVVAGEQDEDEIIEIEEPGWNPEDPTHKDLEPGAILVKDPNVASKAEYDGWVIMKVTSPKISAKLNKEDKSFSMLEAFDYLDFASENDYVLLKTDNETDPNAVIRYYGYTKILEAGEPDANGVTARTPKLFGKVQLKNFAAVEESGEGSINVDAAIIQKINPSTGVEFTDVKDAFAALGSKFSAGDANLTNGSNAAGE